MVAQAPSTSRKTRALAARARLRAGDAVRRVAAKDGLLDAGQAAWAIDDSPMKLCGKCRRRGIDYAEAFRAVLRRLEGATTRKYWYSSADESAARETADYWAHFARSANQVCEFVSRSEVVDEESILHLETTVLGPEGQPVRLTAMTSNPTRFRSKGGDVTLSELAFHKKPREMFKAAVPCTARGGQLSILSTHNGEHSFFNGLILGAKRILAGQGKPDDIAFSLHEMYIDEAVKSGMVERINRAEGTDYTREAWLAQERKKYTAADWAEEMEGIPSQEAGSYFPYDLLRPCVRHDDPAPVASLDELLALLRRACTSLERGGRGLGRLHMGVDVGRKKHRFVLDVIGQAGGMQRTAGTLSWGEEIDPKERDFTQMQGAIDAAMRFRGPEGQRVRRVCIDATGIGMQLAEQTAQRHHHTRAEGVEFTTPTKADLATTAKRHVDERTVTLPDHPLCLADFNGIKKTVTSAGNVRFAGSEDADGHRDFFWARALALHALEAQGVEMRPVEAEEGWR